jgi:hypothetical protein
MGYCSKRKGQFLHDIHTGTGCSHLHNKPNVLGAIFNTDGVQPYRSSTVAVWPLYLAFANLPPNIRMNRDNIVTIAVWVGSKPPMKILFEPLREALARLSEPNGLTIALPDGTKSFTLALLFGIFDLIAKAPVLNMHQHSGSNGCSVCLHPGESFSRRRVYAAGVNYACRSHEMYLTDATKALTEGTIVNGIKGSSPLTDLVDLCDSVPVDYMHCVLEGVTKRLLEVWAKSTDSAAYIGPSLGQVDKTLLMQRPPHDFSRPPRSIIKHRKYWKASEFRNWLLYYSLPLLSDVLPPLFVHHHALLVCSNHILLQNKLQEVQIQVAEDMLAAYYELLPELYGKINCTLNSHLLIHLPKYVRLWGSLWTHSAFGFESFNGFVTSMIHSKFKLGDQLLYSLDVADTLAVLTSRLTEVESEKTLEFLSMKTSHHRNMSQLFPGTYSIGNFVSSLSQQESELLAQLSGNRSLEGRSFHRLYHNDTLYHSTQYGKKDGKRNSTVCCYKENSVQKFGVIQKFVSCSRSINAALITPFKIADMSLLKRLGNPNRNILQSYAEADLLNAFVIPVEKNLLPLCAIPISDLLCKCVYVTCSTINCVIKIPNNFEHH